ncbi:MAG: type II secretion system protein GspG [Kiritimatiellae bacterium]|nr:type II secretion system protein GspG [Kiritimatiellia bacterium]
MQKREENAAVAAMRAGFTLIEILVAVAIIGILGTVATMSITKNLEKAKATAARDAVNNIKGAVMNYYIQNKKYPTDLRQLIEASGDDEAILEGGEGALEDPWGSEYKYERSGKKIVVISAGPDMEFGNDDDIRSDKIEKSNR